MGNVVKGRVAALPACLVLLLGVAACASSTPGTGTAAPGSPVGTAPSSAPTSSAGAPLAAVQPCDLLSDTEVSQHHLTDEGPKNGNGARSCTWSDDSFDDGLGYVLGADIRDDQGLDSYNKDGFSITNITIDNHQAILAKGTTTTLCDITIGVSPTSRVDLSVNTGSSDLNQSCTLVKQYAQLIEPRLP